MIAIRNGWGGRPSLATSNKRLVAVIAREAARTADAPHSPFATAISRRGRLELEGDPVDAVAQAGGRRAVGEHVAQMAAAAAAMHLGAHHAVAAVLGGLHGAGLGRVEARPARTALELGLGDEQR